MENKIEKIGDRLIITIKPKQSGTTILSSFSDTLTGVTSTRTISREYRIIEDNIFYTDWEKLTQNSIKGKEIKQNYYIQVRYTRGGTDETGEIVFQDITFRGDFNPELINSPILDNSIFSDIAWTEETELLTKNLFKKLYYRGILPMYIQRADNDDIHEDRDFINLFYSVARYFAIVIRFFKRFEGFYDDEDLMLEWIRENGIQFDESNTTLEQLQHLARHLYNEISKRGTTLVFKRQGDIVNGKEIEIDGEFIRLIRSKRSDELLYENIPFEKMGWCVGSSSPLYRGTSFAKELNKTKENTEDFQSLDNYQCFCTGGSLSIGKVDNKKVLTICALDGGSCGLGRINENIDVSDKLYVADPNLDYEITFCFNVPQYDTGTKFNFGVEGFDSLKNKLNDAFIMPNGERTTEMFLDNISTTTFIQNHWYFARGIIHAYSSSTIENVKTNLGFGNNLTFDNKFIKYILPKIYMTAPIGGLSMMNIWNYKIRPLVRGTNILPLKNGFNNSHSLGFVQAPRILYMYFRNNNNSQSKTEISDIIERYLLPFNMTDILQFIDSE